MRRRFFGLTLSALLLALCSSASAQQPKQVPRIGFLVAVSPSAFAARAETFMLGLRDLGYMEGKNIVIESRYAEGKLDRLPALAADLVRLKVGVIADHPLPQRTHECFSEGFRGKLSLDPDENIRADDFGINSYQYLLNPC